MRSAPAQNAPPEPVSTSTRSLALSATSRNTAISSSHIGPLMAFFLSGRWSVTVTMPSVGAIDDQGLHEVGGWHGIGYAARPMSIELRTSRLRLRPILPADREALHRIWTEPEVRRFLWDDRVIDLATVDGVIERSVLSFAAESFGLFALRESEAGALVGTCGLYRVAKGAEPELLYSLAPASFGRGLATEAARAVLEDAFTRLRLPRVLARADVPNRDSVRVMERLGMTLRRRARGGRPAPRLLHARERGLAGAGR